ncbi:sigma-70 region 4 [Clostridium sp. CAG:1013]|nr:sigma-70 region 4 [Clostridium sp. CAG:1013]
MRTRVLSFDLLRSETGSSFGGQAANQPQLKAAARVLWTALDKELTPRQRQCVELCVLQGMSQIQASRLLGVNKATVCRHMQKAKRSLKKAAGYTAMGNPRREE